MAQRIEPIRSNKVLRSARGQPCSARFPSICNGNPETTVWAHLNGHTFGKGMGIKAHDVLGFHACADCHAYYDVGHGTKPVLTTEELLACVLDAVCATYVRLIRMGVVVVPIDISTPAAQRPAKARKPPEQRASIPSRPMPSTGRKLASRNDLRRKDKANA
jgi:hypothetical protein